MAELTKDSTIQELVTALPSRGDINRFRHALWWEYLEDFKGDRSTTDKNYRMLVERKVHSLGDLLTPNGELALLRLEGTGPKSMIALQLFLTEKGFSTDWPMMARYREHHGEKATHVYRNKGTGFNLSRAIEEADKRHTIKTGEPVGAFSRKIEENTKAQEEGARLKGRRTL